LGSADWVGVNRDSEQGQPRGAGQHARAEGLRLSFSVVVISIAALALIALAWLVLQLPTWPLVAVELAAIGVMVGVDHIYNSRSDDWLQGAAGERKVGAVIDGLAEDGWQTLHDFSRGGENIDHIVFGPGGIFTVETKSFAGYRHKKRLERITSETVQPLLVYSDAYLLGKVPAFRRGVVILPARMLASYLSRRAPVLTTDQARELHARLGAALVTS
jgi:hypothetical protein